MLQYIYTPPTPPAQVDPPKHFYETYTSATEAFVAKLAARTWVLPVYVIW